MKKVNEEELANFLQDKEIKVKMNDKLKHDLIKFGEESDKQEPIDYEEDEQNFVCKICGKEFDTSAKLDDHMSEHY